MLDEPGVADEEVAGLTRQMHFQVKKLCVFLNSVKQLMSRRAHQVMLTVDGALGRQPPAALSLLIHDTSAIMRPSRSQSIAGSSRRSDSSERLGRYSDQGWTILNFKRCDPVTRGRTDGSSPHLVAFQGEKLTSSLPRLRLLSWLQQCEILGVGGLEGRFPSVQSSWPAALHLHRPARLADWLTECVWSEWLSQGRRGWGSSGGGRTGSHSPQWAADSVKGCRGRLAGWFFLVAVVCLFYALPCWPSHRFHLPRAQPVLAGGV